VGREKGKVIVKETLVKENLCGNCTSTPGVDGQNGKTDERDKERGSLYQ
jgi:hypothetical protein